MFGLFEEKIECPSCKTTIKPVSVRISNKRRIRVFNCPSCNADFIKNKREELFPVLEEGVVLC